MHAGMREWSVTWITYEALIVSRWGFDEHPPQTIFVPAGSAPRRLTFF